MATDLAEVIGGAIALHLLFRPADAGRRRDHRRGVAAAAGDSEPARPATVRTCHHGLTAGHRDRIPASLFVETPPPGAVVDGLVPRFDGTESVLLATAMLGATVMPHAVYLHSGSGARPARSPRSRPAAAPAAARDAAGRRAGDGRRGRGEPAMLLVAATNLQGPRQQSPSTARLPRCTTPSARRSPCSSPIGLLASGLASTSVGAYAGAMIMQGLLCRSYPDAAAPARHPDRLRW